MKELFRQKLRENPVIAAVKNVDHVDAALESDCTVIFLLCGNIFNLKEIVQKAKAKGKLIFLHVDLIDGFSRDAVALRYIAEEIKPDGIISTKNNQLKVAKELGLLTVQRLFIIDSSADGAAAVYHRFVVHPDHGQGVQPHQSRHHRDHAGYYAAYHAPAFAKAGRAHHRRRSCQRAAGY